VDNPGSRNVLIDLGHRVASVKFLIRDRAGQFTSSFDAVFTADGIRILPTPPQASRANAICERMIGTLRREVFDRLLIINEHHLRRVLTEHLLHYNRARPHRSQLTPAHTSSSRQPAAGANQPRRPPDPPEAGPRGTHPRVLRRRLTTCVVTEKRRSPPQSYFRAPQVGSHATVTDANPDAAAVPTAYSSSPPSPRPGADPTRRAITCES
jgi:hypothetical protein